MSRKPKTPRRSAKPRERVTEITPPEGVPVRFDVATLGARFGAQIIDITLTVVIVVFLMIILSFSGWLNGSAILAIGALAFFFLRAPYYVAAEILWNGQTIGKRLLGLRVVAGDGRALSPHSVTVRNLMKEIEVFVPGTMLMVASSLDALSVVLLLIWITILLAIPLFNRRRQRLGDIIAGTFVISVPKPVLMPDLAAQAVPGERFTFLPHHLDHYGRYELQTLEQVLQVDTTKLSPTARNQHQANLEKVTEAIIRRIGFEEKLQREEADPFLRAFYRTQRAYLEKRKLFGDAREDKFHGEDAQV